MAKTLNKTILIRMADGPDSPKSIDFGTIKFPTNPMEYRNVTKKIR
jgi:hypothetical protein